MGLDIIKDINFITERLDDFYLLRNNDYDDKLIDQICSYKISNRVIYQSLSALFCKEIDYTYPLKRIANQNYNVSEKAQTITKFACANLTVFLINAICID